METNIRPQKSEGWKRLLAVLLDTVCLTMINSLFLILAIVTIRPEEPLKFWQGLSCLTWTVYYAIFLTRKGATPGMTIMKIFIGRKSGEPISFGRSLLRLFLHTILSTVTIGIVNFWVFFPKKRTLYDKISDTYIYQKVPAPQPAES